MNLSGVRMAVAVAVASGMLSCGEAEPASDVPADVLSAEVQAQDVSVLEPTTFRVMTFNVGTTDNMQHELDEEAGSGDGYTDAHAAENSSKYSNNLAWNPAETALSQFIADKRPDIVGFQELYYDPWCESVDVTEGLDFVCDQYDPTGPLQIQRLLGDAYQIACAGDHPDNCVGVRKEFGSIPACSSDLCIDGLEGMPVPSGCTSSKRIGWVEVVAHSGMSLIFVDCHTVSGLTEANMACRREHMQQIFEDQGDGIPAAHGDINVVVGDMNTDPFLFAGGDPSAAYWNQWVGEGKKFTYISSSDASGPATHATTMHLDHVIATGLTGSCFVAGESAGEPPVKETSYFDHRPVVCDVEIAQ